MRLALQYDNADALIQTRLADLQTRLYAGRSMIPVGFEPFFRQTARYASVHASTAIEGNTLDYDEAMLALVEGADPDQPLQIEKANLGEAYELMASLAEDRTTKIDEGIIRTINSIVLKDMPDSKARNRGRYRLGPSLIVSAAKRDIRYRPPQPQWVPELMEYLVTDVAHWVRELPGPVTAALAHFGIVSIHPFDDGNGRTARLIADMILNLTDNGADGMITLSQVFHNRLGDYYDALQDAQGEDFRENVDVTSFVRFHTDALLDAASLLESRAVAFRNQQVAFEQAAGGKLSQRHIMGLAFIASVGPLSTSSYAGLVGASQATALSDLNALVRRSLVRREGSSKNTRYKLYEGLRSRPDWPEREPSAGA